MLSQLKALLKGQSNLDLDRQLTALCDEHKLWRFKLATREADVAVMLFDDYRQVLEAKARAVADAGDVDAADAIMLLLGLGTSDGLPLDLPEPQLLAALKRQHLKRSASAAASLAVRPDASPSGERRDLQGTALRGPSRLPRSSSELSSARRVPDASAHGREPPAGPLSDVAAQKRLSALIQHTFLVRHATNGSIYHPNIPRSGPVVAAIVDARKDITAALKRKRHGEATEKALVASKLKGIKFGWRFHLRDVVGLGTVMTLSSGTNTVYKLRQL